MISLRRMTLGSGYRYLMESVATGDGAVGTSSSLTRYYAESGTPPGVFLGLVSPDSTMAGESKRVQRSPSSTSSTCSGCAPTR